MPMRVIAGSARGVVLRAPAGRETRPTSARLRESLFAMLEAADTDFASVVDLYAGSGALGIEALSRGAGRCLFVDSNRRACILVRENLRRAGFAQRGRVVAARVGRWRPSADRAFSLVLADPPYDDAVAWADIDRSIGGALAADAVIAVEHAARTDAPLSLAGCSRWRDRRHGDGAIAAYSCGHDQLEQGDGGAA